MAEKIDRIPTGVPGLDELIEGGIPEGSGLLIAGGTGTGKTILASQITYNVADEGKHALYVTFEEDKDRLIRQMEGLGFPVGKLIDQGRLAIYSVKEDGDINETYADVKKIVEKNGTKLLVIDSLAMVLTLARYYSDISKKMGIPSKKGLMPSGEQLTRESICSIIRKLERLGATVIFVDEADEKGVNITREGVAEFIVDGVIRLQKTDFGTGVSRGITIEKMRETKISLDVQAFEITENGVKVKPLDR